MNSRLFSLGTAITLFLTLAIVHAERSPSVSLEGRWQAQTSDATFYFPDYVAGGGWSVQLVLFNIDTTTAARATVAVYNQNGQRVSSLFARSSLSIPSLGSQILRSRSTGSIRRGWITVEADTPSVSGLLTYRNNQTGIEVGVEPAEFGTRFALFVEESSDIGTGLAIFKPDDSTGVELRIRDEDGNDPLDGEVVRVGNFKQRAKTIREWFEDGGADTSSVSDFRGLLFLQSSDGSRFAPLGLRFGKNTGSLSAVPVIKLAAADDCPAPNPFGGCDPTDPPPPPSDESTLTPGRPVEFRLPKVDSPTLFSGLNSFQLEVPADASRVTVTLESDADVALLVRYGEDNEVQDGRLVYDYSADKVTVGTERIVITRQSDPPLRAGTHFVSAAVIATGVVVNCTLTAEVERGGTGTPPAPTVTLSASPSSIEGGQSSTLRWSSTNATSATISPGIGTVPTSGSQRVSPTRTTTYRITVRSSDGRTASDTATVTVSDPPSDGRTLTPGRPVEFDTPAVDKPTLFHGDYSFRLEVPNNASRVTVTLESDADVILLVRYGEDNNLRDGRLVYDYSADKVTVGTERIVITRQSDPPLRAGTHFVSAAVIATGVAINYTLTAEVERGGTGTPPAPTVTLSASPSSIEGGQSSTLRWSSTNATSATISPGIGTVPTSGSQRVSPTRTTTYRITVRSSDGRTASDTARVTVSDPPDDDEDQTCKKGSIIKPGGKCDLVNSSGTKIGTFEVASSGRGCVLIGGIRLCSVNGHNIRNTRLNQYRVTFVASRGSDGNWTITEVSIT